MRIKLTKLQAKFNKRIIAKKKQINKTKKIIDKIIPRKKFYDNSIPKLTSTSRARFIKRKSIQ